MQSEMKIHITLGEMNGFSLLFPEWIRVEKQLEKTGGSNNKNAAKTIRQFLFEFLMHFV